MSAHADLLSRLMPPVSYAPSGPHLALDLLVDGAALDDANESSLKIVVADPWLFGDASMLALWEELFLLTPLPGATDEQRQQAVLVKLNETGGMSLAYFERILEMSGYEVILDEPRGFFAGTSCAGERIFAPDKVLFFWRVRIRHVDGTQLSALEISRLSAWLADIQVAGTHFEIEV